MTGGDLYGSTLLTLLLPGFGQGLAARRVRALAFAAGTVVATIAILWTVWLLPVMVAVRIAAAVEAFVVLRRHATPSDRKLAAIAAALGAVAVGWYVIAYERFAIPTSSMDPTLVIGDEVLVDKLSIKWRPPERGEVIVFDQPCAHRPYVKRVIALGGDTVEVRCTYVYVNGVRIAEQRDRGADERGDTHDFPNRERMIAPSCQQSDFYAPKPGAAQPIGQLVVTKQSAQPCEQQAHFVVPPHALFVMGDNRNNANDSRYWGAVSLDAVIGRVIGIDYSHPPNGDRQWNRIGALH